MAPNVVVEPLPRAQKAALDELLRTFGPYRRANLVTMLRRAAAHCRDEAPHAAAPRIFPLPVTPLVPSTREEWRQRADLFERMAEYVLAAPSPSALSIQQPVRSTYLS